MKALVVPLPTGQEISFLPPLKICENTNRKIFEPVREKTNNLRFRPGLTQTGLYSHRTLLEAGNFVFK